MQFTIIASALRPIANNNYVITARRVIHYHNRRRRFERAYWPPSLKHVRVISRRRVYALLTNPFWSLNNSSFVEETICKRKHRTRATKTTTDVRSDFRPRPKFRVRDGGYYQYGGGIARADPYVL